MHCCLRCQEHVRMGVCRLLHIASTAAACCMEAACCLWSGELYADLRCLPQMVTHRVRAEENLAAINSNDTETVAIGVQTLVHIKHAMIMDTSEPKISSVNSHEVNLLANYLLACLLAYLLESANSHAQGTQLKGDDTQGKNGVDCLERVIVVIMALLVLLRMAIYCLSASWHSTLVACEASLTLPPSPSHIRIFASLPG